MSNNTNTLFWVITGAVVVLGIFLLTNNSSDNSINTISSKFDGIYNEQASKLDNSKNDTNEDNIDENVHSTEDEQIPEKTQEEIDLEEYMKQSTRYYCKPPISTDERIKIKMVYATDNRIAYNITNISNEDIIDPWFTLIAYNCNNGKAVKHCGLSFDEFKAGQSGTYICSGGSLGADYEYYAVMSIE